MKKAVLSLLFVAAAVSASGWTTSQAFKEIGFDQKPGKQIPLDLAFKDESGQFVHLRDYFGNKPVILNLVYYRCPMLCTEVLNGLTRAMRAMKFTAGRDFTVVTLSIDPRETPKLADQKGRIYRSQYGRAVGSSAWPFLTGDEGSIRHLADTVGFRYAYDADTDQYGHAAGIVVLTPKGKVSRYLLGVEYSANDLRLALLEAGEGTIGSPVDQALLYCYRFDETTGKYGVAIMRLVRAGGLLTLLILAVFVITSLRKEKFA